MEWVPLRKQTAAESALTSMAVLSFCGCSSTLIDLGPAADVQEARSWELHEPSPGYLYNIINNINTSAHASVADVKAECAIQFHIPK